MEKVFPYIYTKQFRSDIFALRVVALWLGKSKTFCSTARLLNKRLKFEKAFSATAAYP